MAEYIEREALIKAMRTMPMPKQAINNDWFGAVTAGVNAEIRLVADFPAAADAVEVVRCKDCKYCYDGECLEPNNRVVTKVPDFWEHYAYATGLKVTETHFCGFGKRRDNHAD